MSNRVKNEPMPEALRGWDGYGWRGQVAYDAQFEFEKEMADRCDPSDPYDKYSHLNEEEKR